MGIDETPWLYPLWANVGDQRLTQKKYQGIVKDVPLYQRGPPMGNPM